VNSFSIGQYVPVDSVVHSLDPRSKFIAVTAALIWIVSSRSFAEIALCTFAFVACAILSKISVRVFLGTLWNVRFFILLTGVIQIFYGEFGGAVKVCLRISIMILFASLLPLTTSPMSVADAFSKIFPQEIPVMIMMALRFIPLLSDEAEKIKKTQIARGARFDDGNILKRLRAYFPILIPLFVIAFKRADELSVAMEARGYVVGAKRSRFRPLEWKKFDSCVTVLSMSLIVYMILVRATKLLYY
jgi:energy-coupling factor transport system permease protein